MVLHLARIDPGVVIKSGAVVLSGKRIRSQAEADDFSLGKVITITDALREFMAGVLHVKPLPRSTRAYTEKVQPILAASTSIPAIRTSISYAI